MNVLNNHQEAWGRWLVIAGIGLGVALVIALNWSGNSAHAANSAAPGAVYSVLKRTATAADGQFAEASKGLKAAARESGLGVDPSGARLIKSKAGKSFAVVPATMAPCLISEDDAVSCGTQSAPVTAQVSYGYAIGLAPDAVKNVSVVLTDGTTTTTTVVDNVWEAPANAESATVTVGDYSEKIGLMPVGSLPPGATVTPDGLVTVRRP